MKRPLRLLLIEDDQRMLGILDDVYRTVFASRGYQPSIEKASSVDEARRLAKSARSKPYDFVSLDVNLGDRVLTGLDVLETFQRFQSAWMVALLTGIETDASLDQTVGRDRADALRKELRRDAYARFPAERLLVIEKPPASLSPSAVQTLLANRLEQIASVYEEVGRLRYIFRPINVTSLERVPAPKGTKAKRKFIETSALHWQIRFDCGEIRTLPDMAGFRTLHYLLSRDPSESVTPEEAVAREPKNEKVSSESGPGVGDPIADYFEAQGISWNDFSTAEQEKLIRAALSLKFRRYCDLREFQDEGDVSPGEEIELAAIVRELGPLAAAAETAYERMTPCDRSGSASEGRTAAVNQDAGLQSHRGDYDRLGSQRGQDSSAAQLFRARMKRVRDCLRENGFDDFARHLEDYLQSTGANWSYNPPQGVEWTT